MAVVRHFALNLVRQVADKRSIKRRRKRAASQLPRDPRMSVHGVPGAEMSLDAKSLPSQHTVHTKQDTHEIRL